MRRDISATDAIRGMLAFVLLIALFVAPLFPQNEQTVPVITGLLGSVIGFYFRVPAAPTEDKPTENDEDNHSESK